MCKGNTAEDEKRTCVPNMIEEKSRVGRRLRETIKIK